jgi:hypothetical protein
MKTKYYIEKKFPSRKSFWLKLKIFSSEVRILLCTFRYINRFLLEKKNLTKKFWIFFVLTWADLHTKICRIKSKETFIKKVGLHDLPNKIYSWKSVIKKKSLKLFISLTKPKKVSFFLLKIKISFTLIL